MIPTESRPASTPTSMISEESAPGTSRVKDSSPLESIEYKSMKMDDGAFPRDCNAAPVDTKVVKSAMTEKKPSLPRAEDATCETSNKAPLMKPSSTRPLEPSSSGQHSARPSYPYYQPYPHSHAHYYYPPGAYYPPPPVHSHQPYPYYAHYPPPGYYPHYQYYAHPPTTKSDSKATQKAAPSSTSTVSQNKLKSKTVAQPTPTVKPTTRPYSAFSSAPKVAAVTTQQSNKPVLKPVLSNAATKKRKSATEPNKIFRSNAKRSKQLAAESKAAAAAIAAKRAKSKEAAEKELSQTVLERRMRKNAQSRLRASKLKQRIAEIQAKHPDERTEEEINTLEVFEERRRRKNGRSRERAMERKGEYEQIMSVSETDWSTEQKNFVQETIVAKFKKNEGDRLRRKKLKDELDSTGSTISSDWDFNKSFSSSLSSKGKSSQSSKRKSTANACIPSYIQSSTLTMLDIQSKEVDDFYQEVVPTTPVTQKDAFSLLEPTPTNLYGSTVEPDKATECFSPNFVFASPSKNFRDLSGTMDAIDFDSLELPIDGTSLLDPSMAIDDEVIFSPAFQTQCNFDIPHFGRLSPHLFLDDKITSRAAISEFPSIDRGVEPNCSGTGSKAIAVSFSVDTA